MTIKPRLLGLSGSLRKASFNTAILTTLSEAVADRATLEIFPLNPVPLYDGDEDTATPPDAVAALRAKIAGADGLVIASPEYNQGISGVLKNALDWASRPYGKSCLTGKVMLTMTASPASTGGARAQANLNETLLSVAAQIVLRPQAVIGAANQKVKDGRLIEAATLAFLQAGINDLLRDIARNASVLTQQS